jgi:hypothetical protein
MYFITFIFPYFSIILSFYLFVQGIYFESLRIAKEEKEEEEVVKQVYHELLVVGYGDFNGKKVFKFRNS